MLSIRAEQLWLRFSNSCFLLGVKNFSRMTFIFQQHDNKLHRFLLRTTRCWSSSTLWATKTSLISQAAELVDAYTWHQLAAYTCYLTLCVFTWYPHFPHLLSNTLWYPHFPHSQPTLLLIADARGADDNERLPLKASGPWSSSHHPLSLLRCACSVLVCSVLLARTSDYATMMICRYSQPAKLFV